MAYTAESLGQIVGFILNEDPGPNGRLRVKKVLEVVSLDKDFINKYLGNNSPQRNILYQDPKLGFAILGHVFKEARKTVPHDHGSSWAIYAQIEGTTTMDGWDVVEPGLPGVRDGKVRLRDSVELTPGNVRVYNENEIHSPRRDGPAKLIRIEGNPNQSGPGRTWIPLN